MAAQWITTIGLLLDICGAFLVASEVVRKFDGEQFKGTPSIDELGDPPKKSTEFMRWELSKFNNMKIGLFLLTIGFILQGVATWLPLWLQATQKT
jgi:hypothetical protein